MEIARRRDVIAVHLEGLTNEALGMRAYAAELLGEMGWAARETVPDIVRALWASTEHEQESMAKALARIDPNATLTMPELVKAFKNDLRLHGEAPLTIGAVARTIGAFGLAALPELSRVLGDGDLDLAILAVTARYYIGPSSIDFLADLLESQNPKIREAAVRGLVQFYNVRTQSEINRAVPILINRFADSDSGIQTTIEDSLVEIGTDALPALRNLLEHENHEVRARATRLMKRIESEASAKD